jgi:hypothetical protein
MKEFSLNERNLDIVFNVPTNFYEVRQQQKIELKTSTFGNISNNQSVSPTYAQKKYLGWSDLDIKANREFLRKDKAFNWELQQIENLGPDWKNALKAQADAAGGGAPADAGAAGAAGGGGGGGGGGMPPPFAGGPATVGGAEGGAPPPEGGAPAPDMGGAAPEGPAPAPV